MENMSTVTIKHMEHPDDEKILEMLDNFEQNSEDGFLRLNTADRVFVISGSEAHEKIKNSITNNEGRAYPLGETEHNGNKFAEYSVNESFFKS